MGAPRGTPLASIGGRPPDLAAPPALVGVAKEFSSSALLARPGAAVQAVVGVDLAIAAGTTVGVVGESGRGDDLFTRPAHHYARALVDAVPDPDPSQDRAVSRIRGELPSASAPFSGWRFRTRCPGAQERCARDEPVLRSFGDSHLAACHFPVSGEPGEG